MRRYTKAYLVSMGALTLALVVIGSLLLRQGGYSAREEPSRLEVYLARALHSASVPRTAKELKNPFPATAENLARARAHFADHCAICHANDGSGQTSMGRNLYPKAPDMRKSPTQTLSDGELFYIIHNGIRLSGMPAWGVDDPNRDDDSWKLVLFIRHLPAISKEELSEMERFNPKSPHELEEQKAEEEFLRGDNPSGTPPGVSKKPEKR